MRSNLIKKFIASALIFSMTLAVTSFIQPTPQIVQADDLEIFKGNISIGSKTTYLGRPAVTIPIPSGIIAKDVDIDNEPHRYIDEIIVNGNIIIYGLRPGVTYNLRLTIEDVRDVDYIYNVNPFTIDGTVQDPNINTGTGGNTQFPDFNPGINVPTIPTQGNRQAIESYLQVVYRNVFGREVDQQGLNYWATTLSSGMVELEDFFKNLLSESEFLMVAPTPQDKIKKLYAGIFQREPDQVGFNYWVARYQRELMEERTERGALREVIDDMTDGVEFKGILAKLGLRG